MRKRTLSITAGLLAIGYGIQAIATCGQTMAIPSYFYPGSDWSQMEQAAPTVGLTVINPDNGPGKKLDPAYVDETAKAQSAGARVLGYVYTSYGRRLLAQVKADINKYYTWYKVDGIFLDEAPTACNRAAYFKSLYTYIKAKGGTAKVAINPGQATNECFVEASDIIVNFEGPYSSYYTWQPAGWETRYPADRFWHIVIETTDADMPSAIALSKVRHAGWVYATPDGLPNPYDTLPADPYWIDELNLIRQ